MIDPDTDGFRLVLPGITVYHIAWADESKGDHLNLNSHRRTIAVCAILIAVAGCASTRQWEDRSLYFQEQEGDAPYRWYTKLQEGDVAVGVLGQSSSKTDSAYTLRLQLEIYVTSWNVTDLPVVNPDSVTLTVDEVKPMAHLGLRMPPWKTDDAATIRTMHWFAFDRRVLENRFPGQSWLSGQIGFSGFITHEGKPVVLKPIRYHDPWYGKSLEHRPGK